MSRMEFHFGRNFFPLGKTKHLLVFEMRLGRDKVSLQAGKSGPSLRFSFHGRAALGTDGKMIIEN
ncbi:MAG: hypothetical protein WBE74_15375 [Terracidiphilus sp.]